MHLWPNFMKTKQKGLLRLHQLRTDWAKLRKCENKLPAEKIGPFPTKLRSNKQKPWHPASPSSEPEKPCASVCPISWRTAPLPRCWRMTPPPNAGWLSWWRTCRRARSLTPEASRWLRSDRDKSLWFAGWPGGTLKLIEIFVFFFVCLFPPNVALRLLPLVSRIQSG